MGNPRGWGRSIGIVVLTRRLPANAFIGILPPRSYQLRGGEGMKSVLVVDDDAVVLSFTARAIGRLGLEVIRVASALEAMQALEANTQICLVVSDVQMPQMSGVELHNAMCKDLRWRSIPRILMTGGEVDNLPPDVLVLRKPFSVSQIRCMVVALLGGTCPLAAHVVRSERFSSK